MDITGHFESASCVIEVDGSDTLAKVKGKLVAELGVPRARHLGVRMRGGGDIGDDDLRICDTVIDEGCAVELYCTGANITPGVIPRTEDTYSPTLSPCDRYLAVLRHAEEMSIFDTETHKHLCRFPCDVTSSPAFSPCGEWILTVTMSVQCAEVHNVKTGALEHSFGDAGDGRCWGTAWSPCGTKLLSCCNKGLQVWDIATGAVVHEWGHIVECLFVTAVRGERVATFGTDGNHITVWDYTTGRKVFVLTCPGTVAHMAPSPNQIYIVACCKDCVRVWNVETGESVFEDVSESEWTDVAMSNDIVAVYSPGQLCAWSISTGEQLFRRAFNCMNAYGLAISSCGGVVVYSRDGGIEVVNISQLC